MNTKKIIAIIVGVLIIITLIGKCSTKKEVEVIEPTQPKITLTPEQKREQQEQAESDRMLAEAQRKYEMAQASKPLEREADIQANGGVESNSVNMAFDDCIYLQNKMAEAILSSGNYNVISIVQTNAISMKRFCTNDGSVIHTCSDGKSITTKSPNKDGC